MEKQEYDSFNFSAPEKLAHRMEKNEKTLPDYRSEFMRDRDRVMYSRSFRRLAGKTQVYLTGIDDHQRNRLTHTLEVSQIARTIAQALGLNCDLTEAIALAHDLGHTPFGHAGEQILHEIMVPGSDVSIHDSPMTNKKLAANEVIHQKLYGFKHNIQGVRVAASLECGFGNYGLNLTNYTLWGILNHSSLEYHENRVNTSVLKADYISVYRKHLLFPNNKTEAWSFEAYVVAMADEIAQWHHDLEDALRGRAMTCPAVCKALNELLGSFMLPEDADKLEGLKSKNDVSFESIYSLSGIVVNTLVTQLVKCSKSNLSKLWSENVKNENKKEAFFLEGFQDNKEKIESAIAFSEYGQESEKIKKLRKEYPNIISEQIHHSREVVRMNAKGQYIIKKLFQAYFSHPQQLSNNAIAQYMIDIGEIDNLEAAERCGNGAIRTQFDSLVTDSTKYTLEKQIQLMRRICDYIAGMTDHYAIEEYNNLYG